MAARSRVLAGLALRLHNRPAMRRHLTAAALAGLTALAAPGVARAQVLGEVKDAVGLQPYINATQCQDQAQTIDLRWWVTVPNLAVTNGIYRVWASNTAPTVVNGFKQCAIADNTTANLYVEQVNGDNDDLAIAGETLKTGTFDAWRFPTGANMNCDEAADRTIYVCVHFHPYETGTVIANLPTGSATGTIVLSTGKPSTPTGLSLGVGDTRLYASWSTGSGGIASTASYDVVATAVDPADDPDTHTKNTTSSSRQAIGDLKNGVPYSVVVYAVSPAGTRSLASDAQVESPQPVKNFWDIYQGGAGVEKGGCGGPAGPLSLLGLVAALYFKGRPSAGGARRKP
jgi:hypothetical protein